MLISADEMGGGQYNLTGPGSPEGGPKSDNLCVFLSFSVVSLFADCTN